MLKFYINTKDFTLKYLLEKPEGDEWEEISDKQYLMYVGVVNKYAPLRFEQLQKNKNQDNSVDFNLLENETNK